MKLVGWLVAALIGVAIWLRRLLWGGLQVIGVAGVPDDLATWLGWFNHIPSLAWDILAIALIAGGAIQIYRISVPAFARLSVPPSVLPTTPSGLVSEPDISATEAHNQVLVRGHWTKEQRSNSPMLSDEQLQKRLDQKIHDHLSLGKLVAWGRPNIPGRAKLGPMTEIPRAAWAQLEIVFNEKAKGGDETVYRTGTGNTRYNDVHFCSVQFYSLFPLETEQEAGQLKQTNDEVLGAISWRFLSPGNYFIAARGRGHYVDYFGVQASGRNESDEIIIDFSGFIRSEVTGREYPITVSDGRGNLIDPKGYGIPARHGFHFQVRFNGDQPMNMNEFLRDFRRMTIALRYNGTQYKRTIMPEELEREVDRAERELRRKPPVSSYGIKKLNDA